MMIQRKNNDFQFVLYIRKYIKIILKSDNDVVNQEKINAMSDEELNDSMKIFIT